MTALATFTVEVRGTPRDEWEDLSDPTLDDAMCDLELALQAALDTWAAANEDLCENLETEIL